MLKILKRGPFLAKVKDLEIDWNSDMAIDKLSITAGTPAGCNDVTLTLVVDQYPEETSWTITDGGGATVASGAYTNSTPDNSTVIENACLPTG